MKRSPEVQRLLTAHWLDTRRPCPKWLQAGYRTTGRRLAFQMKPLGAQELQNQTEGLAAYRSLDRSISRARYSPVMLPKVPGLGLKSTEAFPGLSCRNYP